MSENENESQPKKTSKKQKALAIFSALSAAQATYGPAASLFGPKVSAGLALAGIVGLMGTQSLVDVPKLVKAIIK